MIPIIQGNDAVVSVILHQRRITLADTPAEATIESHKIDLSQVRDLSVRLIPYMGWAEVVPEIVPRGNVLEVTFPAAHQRPGKWDIEISYFAPAPSGDYQRYRIKQAFAEVFPAWRQWPGASTSACVITAEVAEAIQGAPGQDAYHYALGQGLVANEAEWFERMRGPQGLSAYELAVKGGYTGSLDEWLTSLTGVQGDKGDSAYQLARQDGFTGTQAEWMQSLRGDVGKSVYQSYLDTTSDNPKLSERDWANNNDYVYQIIHLIVYGSNTTKR